MSDLDQRVRDLLGEGEGPSVEFKSSFRWDLREGKVNKEMTKIVMRTLAAFLNSHGGTLLLGVSDEGELLDLETDINTLGKKNLDGYELTLRAATRNISAPRLIRL
jgi:predicted HTH transcriptional regulator